MSLLAMGHIVLSIVLLRGMHGNVRDWTAVLLQSLIATQLSLASLWVGFGIRHYFYRWGAFAGAIGLWVYLGYYSDINSMAAFLAYLVWHAALVVLGTIGARFIGVRLVTAPEPSGETAILDDSTPSAANDRMGRFDLSQIFTATTVIAMMAATARLRGMPLSQMWPIFIGQGAPAVVALAGAWAMLARGPCKRRVLLVVFCSSVVEGGRMAMSGTEPWLWV